MPKAPRKAKVIDAITRVVAKSTTGDFSSKTVAALSSCFDNQIEHALTEAAAHVLAPLKKNTLSVELARSAAETLYADPVKRAELDAFCTEAVQRYLDATASKKAKKKESKDKKKKSKK